MSFSCENYFSMFIFLIFHKITIDAGATPLVPAKLLYWLQYDIGMKAYKCCELHYGIHVY